MTKIYILDTNVLIQAPYAISCFKDNDIVIPLVVLMWIFRVIGQRRR